MTSMMFLDTPSLGYRAFFAVPKTITDEQGRPVNAVRGVMDMITTLKLARHPDEVVAVFDADWRPSFRVEAYEGYKSERPEEPPELTRQFDLMLEVLDAAGIRRAEAAGYEADDVIATLAAAVEGEDRAMIVTGDRDLLCLVRDPYVVLLFTVRGVTDLKIFDEASVKASYGVEAQRYCEFAMLRGDSSDGLPGVVGVGPKTAVTLLAKYDSIEHIYENLEELSPRQQKSFAEARDYLAAMREVVPPRQDAPFEATEGKSPDVDRLLALGEEHNLDGPARRLLGALGVEVEPAAS
jgi:5'-3' exonuclease